MLGQIIVTPAARRSSQTNRPGKDWAGSSSLPGRLAFGLMPLRWFGEIPALMNLAFEDWLHKFGLGWLLACGHYVMSQHYLQPACPHQAAAGLIYPRLVWSKQGKSLQFYHQIRSAAFERAKFRAVKTRSIMSAPQLFLICDFFSFHHYDIICLLSPWQPTQLISQFRPI